MIPVFIPARAGSKSVPDKNMRTLKGKPLLQWAIEAAQKSNRVDEDHIFVSTDSPKYGKFAEDLGVNWIKRPPELAEDVPTEDVILHALGVAEKQAQEHYDPIVTLQCTTPLVHPKDIDMAIHTYRFGGIYNSLISITECREHPYWTFKIEGLRLKPFLKVETRGEWGVRQKLPPIFRPNGAVYITKTSFLKEHKALIGEPLGYTYMPPERSYDIDEEVDLIVAEVLANYQNRA